MLHTLTFAFFFQVNYENKNFIMELCHIIHFIHTVKPCAISSSGTNSGLNRAAVIQGKLAFTGKTVTRRSPFAVKIHKKIISCLPFANIK